MDARLGSRLTRVATAVTVLVAVVGGGAVAASHDPDMDSVGADTADRWARYYSAQSYGAHVDALHGRYSGVGMWLHNDDGSLVVTSVAAGAPADRAGIREGQVLVAVDGVAVGGSDLPRAVTALRGAPGSAVEAVVRGAAGSRSITIQRDSVTVSSLAVDQISDAVMVVRLGAVTEGAADELREALTAEPRAAAGGVILDLRGNGGGLLTEAVDIASVFLGAGPVVSYGAAGEARRTLSSPGPAAVRSPLVVLIDAETASAAEVVAGALQDRGRAIVVGSPSFGKGSVQAPVLLADGRVLERTVGHYVLPSGRQVSSEGLTPDVRVIDTSAEAAAAGAGLASEVALEARAVAILAGMTHAGEGQG